MSVWGDSNGCLCNLFLDLRCAGSLHSASLRSRWQVLGEWLSPLFVISTGENLWFLEWRNLFIFSALRLSSWEFNFPFRLSEWNGAHGEICVYLLWTLSLDLSTPLRYGRDDRGLREWLSPLFVISTGEVVRLRSGEIFSFFTFLLVCHPGV